MNELMNLNHAGRGTLTEFDRMMNSLFRPFADFVPEVMGPAVDFPQMEVMNSEKDVTVSIPLPGYKKGDISVEVVGNLFTVRAKRTECEEKQGHFVRKERSCASYEETVRLPSQVKGGEACAKYVDGILTVQMPKEAPQINSHKVEVM